MRGFRHIIAICVWLLPLAAQAQQDDRGILQAFIEDNLSDAGRTVRIEGFEGALSSEVTIDKLTIADDDGIWLTLGALKLNWSRSALLRGRLQVEELSAGTIDLPRAPDTGGPSPKDAEAGPFQLPDLPIAVNIGKIAAEKVSIGADLLGQDAVLSLTGNMRIEGGEGAALLSAQRIDDRRGEFKLDAAFSNTTRELALDLSLAEGAGGIVSSMLGLPGAPSLSLAVLGDAPLSDFRADIALETDGQPRAAGEITLADVPADQPDTPPARRFGARLAGDVTPLFAPDMQDFFGPDVRLTLQGQRAADGTVSIAPLSMQAAQMRLDGTLVIAADGLPQSFDLNGRIGGDGPPVVLPLAGPVTRLQRAELSAAFDAAKGDGWQARIRAVGLNRSDVAFERAEVTGRGTVTRNGVGGITASLALRTDGLALSDPSLARAVGASPSADADLDWVRGGALNIRNLLVDAGGLSLAGQAGLGAVTEGIPTSGRLRIKADDLARFSGLAGRDIGGAGDIALTGSVNLLGGAFDVDARAVTEDLTLSLPQADPLIGGRTELSVSARRDAEGTTLDALSLRNAQADLRISGQLSSQSGALRLQAALEEIASLADGLTGPARLTGDLDWQAGGPLRLSSARLEAMGASATGEATLAPDDPKLPATATLELSVEDLSAFSTVAGRSLAGAAALRLQGAAGLRDLDFEGQIDVRTRDLGLGLGSADRLWAGESRLSMAAKRDTGIVMLRALDLQTPQLTAVLTPEDGGTALQLDAALSDLGLLLPELPGPATARGRFEPGADSLGLSVALAGPGGSSADIVGTIANDAATADLALNGAAPLGVANPFIAPNSLSGMAEFALVLQGKPALSALGGMVTTQGARLALPDLGMAVEDIAGRVRLADGRSEIELEGGLSTGGRIGVAGPVGLSAPYPADMTVTLRRAVLRDPELFQTSIGGEITLRGPLTGGGSVGGTLELGPTEISIPSSGIAGTGSIPKGMRHLNEPAAVRATRLRAGLRDAEATGNGGPPFDLDLRINAPNQLFLRGRGLDSEFGGELRLGGTTQNVIPTGQLELLRGRLDILGKRLTLTEGGVFLQGALDPYFRLVAETDAGDVSVRIVTQGLISAPEVQFESEPPLPEDEVLAQLLFGHDIQNLSAFQAAQLASAVATLAGEGDGTMGKLRQAFNLDDIDVRTDEAEGTSVSVGKYLSDNIYTDVTIGSAGESEINLNIDLSSSLTAKGRATSLGETGIGIFWERDY